MMKLNERLSLGDFNQCQAGNLCGSFELQKNVLDQVYSICHSAVNLPSYLLLASLIIVVFYYNRFVTTDLIVDWI